MEIREFILEQVRRKGNYTNLDESIIRDDLLDSFDYIELISALEGRYNVELNLEKADSLTVNGLVSQIEKLI